MLVIPVEERSWKTIRRTIDMVPRNVCGHFPYPDMKSFLIKNNLWNNAVERYSNDVVENCARCRHTSIPRNKRKVSLKAMSRSSDEPVYIDHCYPLQLCLLYVINSTTWYSSCKIVPRTALADVVLAFESCWIKKFWPSKAVLNDPGFEIIRSLNI